MKNITVLLPDDTARWVRVWAAEQDKSVSRALADLLEEYRAGSETRKKALKGFLSHEPRNLNGGNRYPGRDELYER